MIATKESPKTCSHCGAHLLRTGQKKGDIEVMPEGKYRKKPVLMWMPSLLVTICPNCDAWRNN